MKFKKIVKRLKNSMRNVKNNPNLVFLHVPKCGGTTIDTAIRYEYLTLNKSYDNYIYHRVDSEKTAFVGGLLYNLNFSLGDVKNNRNMIFNRDYMAYYLLSEKLKYISGHFPFDDKVYECFKNDFDFFTILRDPVDKWLSNYYYRKKRQPKIKGKPVNHWKITEDIENYLDSERGKFHGYDYVKYYGGIREDYNYTSGEAIQNAKNNLKKFKVVGFLDELDELITEFQRLYQFELKFEMRNVSESNKKNEISDELRSKIEKVCVADIEIYNYAKELKRLQKKV